MSTIPRRRRQPRRVDLSAAAPPDLRFLRGRASLFWVFSYLLFVQLLRLLRRRPSKAIKYSDPFPAVSGKFPGPSASLDLSPEGFMLLLYRL